MLQLLKPARLESVLQNKRSHNSEKPATAKKNGPHSPQLQKLVSSNEDPAQPKIKK